jgi:hypothetical protein
MAELDKALDDAAKKVEDAAKPLEEKLEKIIESNPVLEKVVHVVDEKLAGVGCGVTLFGWDFSLRKSRPSTVQTPATSEVGVNTESK